MLGSREFTDMDFQVVLALDIFHRFLNTREGYHKLLKLLSDLQMGELFFQLPVASGPWMQKIHGTNSTEGLVTVLLQQSRLATAELVGLIDDKDALYKLH